MTDPTPLPEACEVARPDRLPKGSECQCMADGCGLFFTGESAFKKHWTKVGHVHPTEAGLVEKTRASGPVWGMPGDSPFAGTAT